MFVCALLMGFLSGSAGPFSHRLHLLQISKNMAQTIFNVIHLTHGPQKLASVICKKSRNIKVKSGLLGSFKETSCFMNYKRRARVN